jgi:NAD-specific glutamate dehydrogenase
MAAKELAQHRRDAQKHYAGLRHNIRDRDAEQTSRKYQRFSQELLAEWLADGLKTLAQIELRDRLIGIATDAAEKRAERARKYFGRSGKAHSRNWSRYAPDHTPSWAKWEEHT